MESVPFFLFGVVLSTSWSLFCAVSDYVLHLFQNTMPVFPQLLFSVDVVKLAILTLHQFRTLFSAVDELTLEWMP